MLNLALGRLHGILPNIRELFLDVSPEMKIPKDQSIKYLLK